MNIIDIHCHPSMKIYLFDKHIYHEYEPDGPGLRFSTNMFVNLPYMEIGQVNAGVCIHHIPENELKTDVAKTFLGKVIEGVVGDTCTKIYDTKFQDISSTYAAFKQVNDAMDMFEADVQSAADNYGFKVKVAKSFAEFMQSIADGYTTFVHSIEGAHVLGLKDADAKTMMDEVNKLSARGVCQFTLGHFFENALVSSQGGVPEGMAKILGYDAKNTYTNGYNGDIAKAVITRMLDKGIIVDLCHSRIDAKEMIFKLNEDRGAKMRPLVFSHTGLQGVVLKYNPDYPQPGFLQRDIDFLPTDEDILRIQKCGGVLGIIFMDYWLFGKDEVSPGVDYVVESMLYIAKLCGNFDNVAIGSDLDGFTDVPKDLKGEMYMPTLLNAMRAKISEPDIQKICFDNYKRVLAKGWGPQ